MPANIYLEADEESFTMVSNELIKDKRLSYRAIGLYTVLRLMAYYGSKHRESRNKVELKRDDLWGEGGREGRDALDKAIAELQRAGYLSITPTRKGDGTLRGWTWRIHTCDSTLDWQTSVR